MKKICFITSSRADYGLLSNLILKIKKRKKLKLEILVTGSHLSKKKGYTVAEIIKDGFFLGHKILLNNNVNNSINNQISETIKKINLSLKKIKPNLVVVLGDRFEIFAAVIATFFLKIPIAHIHGGEVTEGAFDDNIRHAITKFSSLHLVSADAYKKRVIQLGENPKDVYNFGSLGVENIKKIKFASKQDLEKEYRFKFRKYNILITLHPETFQKNSKYIYEFMKAMYEINKFKDFFFFFTGTNLDPHSKKISNLFRIFCKKNSDNSVYIESLGKKNYLSLLKYVDLIVGNSSSGIIEAPSLKTKTLNVGNRQLGRLQSKSVFNCKFDKKVIVKKLLYTLKCNIKNTKIFFYNKHEKKNTSNNIIKVLNKTIDLKINSKKFFDL
jgi:UDP-hydrolysing UDP-N-acetyl-D-glucosamine 2-epimerase